MFFLKNHMDIIDDQLNRISEKHSEKKMLLDIGCGDGSRTLLFRNDYRVLYGVDRINWLKNNSKSYIKFKNEDFNQKKLSFEDESFDIIFCFDVIEHLSDTSNLLNEAYRLLKKNGIFIISTPNRNRFFNFFQLILGLRSYPWPPKPSTNNDPYSQHIIEYSIKSLKDLLGKYNFDVIKKHRIFYGLTGRIGIRTLFSFPFFHNIIMECVKRKQ